MIVGPKLDEIRRLVDDLERSLAEVDAVLAQNIDKIDSNPRSQWPQGSVLARALCRHELRCLGEENRRRMSVGAN